MNKSVATFAVAAAALLALLFGVALALRHDAASTPFSASALFTHTFDDADGKAQPIAQWQGRWLVVNFWATWCAPCIEEMPDLQTVRQEYAGRGVTVIALAIDNAAAVNRFRDELKLQLPLLIAGAQGSELIRQLGNGAGGLPYTVLIDQRGRVVQSKLGRLRANELRAWLDARVDSKASG